MWFRPKKLQPTQITNTEPEEQKEPLEMHFDMAEEEYPWDDVGILPRKEDV